MTEHPKWTERLLQMCRILAWGLLLSSLGACALTPKKEQTQQLSDALLQAQLQQVQAQWKQEAADTHKHVFLGSAQHSQSLVFQRDILLMQQSLQAFQASTVSILLSNQLETQQLRYPFATVPNLDRVFKQLSAWSHAHPMQLTIFISTHGLPDVLSVNIANQYFPPLRTAPLKAWLDQLHPRTRVTLLLSACYSGSFVDALQGPNRMVLSASAADRNSFGCRYNEKNTWFIGQLLGPRFAPQSTWDDVFTAMRTGVEQQELAERMSPPSNPQIRSAENLRKMRLAEWFGKPISQP